MPKLKRTTKKLELNDMEFTRLGYYIRNLLMWYRGRNPKVIVREKAWRGNKEFDDIALGRNWMVEIEFDSIRV